MQRYNIRLMWIIVIHSVVNLQKNKLYVHIRYSIIHPYEIYLVLLWYCIRQDVAAGAGGDVDVRGSTWCRWGGCSRGGLLGMLQLLPVDFPLFGASVLEPDLHLKHRWTQTLNVSCTAIFIRWMNVNEHSRWSWITLFHISHSTMSWDVVIFSRRIVTKCNDFAFCANGLFLQLLKFTDCQPFKNDLGVLHPSHSAVSLTGWTKIIIIITVISIIASWKQEWGFHN